MDKDDTDTDTATTPRNANDSSDSIASACSLPDWDYLDALEDEGKPMSPLERFVYAQEPAGTDASEKFREQLIAVLEASVETRDRS